METATNKTNLHQPDYKSCLDTYRAELEATRKRLEEINVDNLSKEEKVCYERSLNEYRTNLCVMDAAKLEGLEEGRKEEGRKEGVKEVARSLKALGTPIDTIIQATGLTQEEINAL